MRFAHGGNVWQAGDPGRWLDFSANIRPGGPPEWVQHALGRAMARVSFYPELSMAWARAALSQYAGISAACALPTAGGIGAIDLVCRLTPGRVLAFEPGFVEYERCALAAGRPAVGLPLLRGHQLLDPVASAAPLAPGDTLFLCNPINPVGCAFDRETLARLLALAEERGARLAVDEAFIDYCPERSVRDWVPAHPALVITGSLTKVLGIPGVRLGYLLGSGPLIEGAQVLMRPWELNAFAGEVLLDLPEHLADLKEECIRNRERRQALYRLLGALDGYIYPSEANFLLVDFGRPMAEAAARLREQGILVRSCASFRSLDDNHLRLAVKDGQSNETLARALTRALEDV